MEIKPIYIDGEPRCSEACDCLCGYKFTNLCIPGLKQQRDNAEAEIVVLRDLLRQQGCVLKAIYKLLDEAEVRPPLIKAELGCMTCRNATRKATDTYCDGCEFRKETNGSKWQPIQEDETHE
jgi:hypothetical protein